MPNREAKTPQIQFDKMGGLNERPALNATPAPDFPILHALYQRRAGSLQRLEGTRNLAALPSGVGILGGNQLDDGTGNVVVQGDNGTEYLFTLDELFGRTAVDTLVYLPLPDDNNMPTAILIQDAANGTAISTIGTASANTFATRELTSNPINESGIVITFASGANASFEVAAGTYRIRGWVGCNVALVTASGATQNTVEGGFQAAITDTTTTTTVATGSPAEFSFKRATTASTEQCGPINLQSLIDTTFTIAGPANSVLQVKNAFSQTAGPAGSVAIIAGNPAKVTATLNGAALRQPYLYLNLAKVT